MGNNLLNRILECFNYLKKILKTKKKISSILVKDIKTKNYSGWNTLEIKWTGILPGGISEKIWHRNEFQNSMKKRRKK